MLIGSFSVALTLIIVFLLYFAVDKLLKIMRRKCLEEKKKLCWFVHRIQCAEKEGCPFQHFYSRVIWLRFWVLVGILIDHFLLVHFFGSVVNR